MDWSPFFGLTNFDKKQVLWLGTLSLGKGIFTELARRRNMNEVSTVVVQK